jgi:hypothetical protein
MCAFSQIWNKSTNELLMVHVPPVELHLLLTTDNMGIAYPRGQ